MDGAEDEALPPLRVGPGLRRFEVAVAAGARLPYVEADWRGALVIVERGEIELLCSRGGRRRFGTGSILWFDGLGLRTLYNPGTEPTVLVAVARHGR